jgi:soluble calcium-activated nucleotidase 1
VVAHGSCLPENRSLRSCISSHRFARVYVVILACSRLGRRYRVFALVEILAYCEHQTILPFAPVWLQNICSLQARTIAYYHRLRFARRSTAVKSTKALSLGCVFAPDRPDAVVAGVPEACLPNRRGYFYRLCMHQLVYDKDDNSQDQSRLDGQLSTSSISSSRSSPDRAPYSTDDSRDSRQSLSPGTVKSIGTWRMSGGDGISSVTVQSFSRYRRPSSSALFQGTPMSDSDSPVSKPPTALSSMLRQLPVISFPSAPTRPSVIGLLNCSAAALLLACVLTAAAAMYTLRHIRNPWAAFRGRSGLVQHADFDRPNGWSSDSAFGPWLLGMVSDEDKRSAMRVGADGKFKRSPIAFANHWASWYKRGALIRRADRSLHMTWLDEVQLDGTKSRHGRGMELSCLAWFQGRLLTPDDRGFLYELKAPRAGLDPLYSTSSPRGVEVPYLKLRGDLLDADDKPFKAEWSVVKDDRLIIGGHGREMTSPDNGSEITSISPMFVQVLDYKAVLSNRPETNRLLVNWTRNYNALRARMRVKFPGFLMHEAVLWSRVRQKFYFLPRRVSAVPYDSADVEFRGDRIVLEVDSDFMDVRILVIEGLPAGQGERGFSAAAFVPGSDDQWVIALRSVEHEHEHKRETSTYLSIFDLARPRAKTLLIPEHKISKRKFEGISFL